MQVFLFTQNLLPEVKEDALQRDGKPWPTLQAAIDAALGTQKRLHASQPAKKAKLAAVHAVVASDDVDMPVSDDSQVADAGYPEAYMTDYDHTLAAVHQRRPGQPYNNAQRGGAMQHRPGQGSNQHANYQQKYTNNNNNHATNNGYQQRYNNNSNQHQQTCPGI